MGIRHLLSSATGRSSISSGLPDKSSSRSFAQRAIASASGSNAVGPRLLFDRCSSSMSQPCSTIRNSPAA